MSRGIIGTAKLAVTLAFAIPLGVFGVDYLLRSRPLIGGVALAVAVLMVVVEEYLTTPADLPEAAAETAAGVIIGTGGRDNSQTADGPDEPGADGPGDR